MESPGEVPERVSSVRGIPVSCRAGPRGGKTNNPGEGRDINLRRTRTYVTVSTQCVERDPGLGDALYLPVDIEATYTFKAYRENQDPVIEAALGAEILQCN